jgi:cell division septation protein DedD
MLVSSCITALLASAIVSNPVHAQTGATSADSSQRGLMPTVDAQNVIERVRGLAGGGRSAEARLLLDSLVAASANASLNAAGNSDANLAEALYWRATLSEQAADAERDWKRLVLDVPLSARAPAALLKLGDSETSRGRSNMARVYYERVLRDYGSAPERWRATLGISRSYFDDRDVAHACATIAGTRSADVPDGELRLQAQALQTRCANEQAKLAASTAPVTAPVPAPSTTSSDARRDVGNGKGAAPAGSAATERIAAERAAAERAARSTDRSADAGSEKTAEKSSGTRYSVQVAAYDTKAQADAVVKKLAKRGFKARVDGTRKPFRVRVGSYATHAEADAALTRMKKAGQKGFIAEILP